MENRNIDSVFHRCLYPGSDDRTRPPRPPLPPLSLSLSLFIRGSLPAHSAVRVHRAKPCARLIPRTPPISGVPFLLKSERKFLFRCPHTEFMHVVHRAYRYILLCNQWQARKSDPQSPNALYRGSYIHIDVLNLVDC